jgi:Tetratricopeptide repeat
MEQVFGSDSPEAADALKSLAVLYRATADYAKAEPLHRRALNVSEKTLGRSIPVSPGPSITWACCIRQ